MASREQLLNEINEVSFAVNEATLFLDTHPDDEAALAFFKETLPRRKTLMEQFAKEYEPLTVDCICPDTDHWSWTDGPLPWEGGK